MKNGFILAGFCAGLLAGLCACTTPPGHRVIAGIYSRATNQVAEVVLLKPAEGTEAAQGVQMAPLLLQETGRPVGAERGEWPSPGSFQVPGPALYAATGTRHINGVAHEYYVYAWFYGATPPPQSRHKVTVQAIRITLDRMGRPAIWEVLNDRSGADLVFVARSLEERAREQFGNPLPGRRYAVERSTSEAPRTVLVRVLEDGPVPMGPIIYLGKNEGEVRTVICRCMPAQAKSVSGSANYALLPMDAALIALETEQQYHSTKNRLESWLASGREGRALMQHLRLPADF